MGYLYKFHSRFIVLLSSGEGCYCLSDQHRWHKRQPHSSVVNVYAVDIIVFFSLPTQISALLSLDISVDRLSLRKQIYGPRLEITSHSLTMYFILISSSNLQISSSNKNIRLFYDIWDSDGCQFKLLPPFSFLRWGITCLPQQLSDYIARGQEVASGLNKQTYIDFYCP